MSGFGRVVVFPGQGTQRVGMGGWLLVDPGNRDIVASVSAACGRDLLELCRQGPAELLRDTRWAQPAVFAVGAVCYRYMTQRGLKPDLVAGHSVGELAALWAAGALDLDTAAALVSARGRIMSEMRGDGAMLALSGVGEGALRDLLQIHAPGLDVALHNGPQDWVVAGARDEILVAQNSLAPVCRRMRILNTSHAFHSRHMAPALEQWTECVRAASMSPAQVPVAMNHDASVAWDPVLLADGLVRQLTGTVRWHEISQRHLTGIATSVFASSDEKSLLALARPYAPRRLASLADLRALQGQLESQVVPA